MRIKHEAVIFLAKILSCIHKLNNYELGTITLFKTIWRYTKKIS